MKQLLLAAACLTLLIPPLAAQEEAFLEIPPPERILETLRHQHPRVAIETGTFERVRVLIGRDETVAGWHAALLQQAEAVLDQPVSEHEIPDGKRLLATSRRVLDRVTLLAYAWHTTGDDRFLARAWIELEAAAAFKDWNPNHFLDTAEMTCAFGVGYDWLYSAWTAEQRDLLREAIIRHGLEPGLARYRGESHDNWWTRTTNNWNQVCNGGLAVGALAIADEAPDIAAEILAAGLRSLPIAMRKFAPDGGCEEGPAYWHYAVRYNVRHLVALDTALGTDFGFSRFPGFEQTGDVPVYLSAPNGDIFNYADGRARPMAAPELFWLAARFDRPDWGAWQRQRARPSPLDVICGANYGVSMRGPAPPLDRLFEGVQVATMRSAWNDADPMFVGIKAGDNSASHGHLDLGSFVFDALGERWAVDIGSDNYNLPAYFGARRWTYYRLRAESHNTLLIDPGAGPDQDPGAVARFTKFTSEPDEARAVVDLTAAYPAARKVQRGFALLDNRTRLLIQDEITFGPDASPAPVRWALHTPADIDLDNDGQAATLTIGDRAILLRVIEPAGAVLRVAPAAPLPSSPNPDGQANNQQFRRVEIQPEPGADMRVIVHIGPTDWRPTGPVPPLAGW